MPYFKPDGSMMTPEETFMLKLDLNKIHPYHGKPKDYDPFSVRYGYVPGRCNAYRRHGNGLCRNYPRPGRARCKRHDTWFYRILHVNFT